MSKWPTSAIISIRILPNISPSPFSQKNVQECRCGADACRGVLGPKPKESKSKDDSKNKTAASKPKGKTLTKQRPAGTKRKIDSVLSNKPTSQLNKKQKVAVTSSLKAGVKKAVARTTTRGRAAAGAKSRTKATTKTTSQRSRIRKPAPTSSGTRTLNRPTKPIIHSSIRSARATARSPAALKRLMAATTPKRASKRGK